MSQRILVTGSQGLIGRSLRTALQSRGVSVVGLDLTANGPDHGDVRDSRHVAQALQGCSGVVHLAAMSRVVWAERDPEACWSTNVGGLGNVLDAVAACPQPPWLIFASSREVYGQPEVLPATEGTPLRPLNAYARSKVEGERLVDAARANGLRIATLRLSNVYGCTRDHADRVVPAFARAAVAGSELRVDGAEHTFDFTHVDDIVSGLTSLVDCISDSGTPPPPIQLVSGVPTTLSELARLAIDLAKSSSGIALSPPRAFDVARFYGLFDRASSYLGWRPRVSLEQGLARLVAAFEQELTR